MKNDISTARLNARYHSPDPDRVRRSPRKLYWKEPKIARFEKAVQVYEDDAELLAKKFNW